MFCPSPLSKILSARGSRERMVTIEGLAGVSDAEGGAAAAAALIRAALGGDRAAMEQLLAPHRQPLVTFCYRLLGSAEDADEPAQETFFRALNAPVRLRG